MKLNLSSTLGFFIGILFSYTQEIQVRTFLMRSYQTMPYIDYTKRNSAEYIFNINGLASQFSQSIVQSWLRLFSEGIVTFSIILLLAFTDIYSLVALIVLISTLLLVFWNIPIIASIRTLNNECPDGNNYLLSSKIAMQA